ncbi:GAF domain-containing protein [Paenibacillus lentus]|uniref:GAF domain-containing protein n=1 Tax=Paenibacillus lentus TaxID=1338368 RepID=A0A3S8RUN6_9BACL|nr:GAF domain-containing protein [Paenibacillus lentus]AZK46564.1 GAF domain-containing protein [Paenibacillus lentus]
MFVSEKYSGTREEQYAAVRVQLRTLLEGEPNRVANLANAAALLNQFLEQINWVGFYLYEDGELVLGPFQGLPACIRIPLGRGVCGTAAKQRTTVLVDDVEQFPGHIACDAASRSEIVVPLIKDGDLLGVLDIDSPVTSRFDELDREQLEQFVEELVRHL